MIASRMIETGDADLVLAGGVESMTRAPWVLPKPSKAFPAQDVTAVSTTLGWRLVNPQMPQEWTVSLGEANEQLADRHGIGRDRQDAFAARSHQLAAAAWDDGFYDDLVVPVEGLDARRGHPPGHHHRDPGRAEAGVPARRHDHRRQRLAAQRRRLLAAARLARPPAPGPASSRRPGSPAAAPSRWRPQEFGYAPVEAANRALARAGIGWSDVGAVELNEAFAVQSLACLDGWGVDPEIVNTRGGAIAHRPPARRLRRPHPGHAGQGAPRARRPLGRRRDLHRRRPGPGRRPRERPRGGLSR